MAVSEVLLILPLSCYNWKSMLIWFEEVTRNCICRITPSKLKRSPGVDFKSYRCIPEQRERD